MRGGKRRSGGDGESVWIGVENCFEVVVVYDGAGLWASGVSGGETMTDFKIKTTAEDWIASYDDLDVYIADCDDADELWLLARAMEDDALASGFGRIDVGEMMAALVRRRCAHQRMSAGNGLMVSGGQPGG